MSTCSCGSVTIDCPEGCGCVCAGDMDCVRWCEPSDPFFVTVELQTVAAAGTGALVRSTKQADGTERLTLNARVANPPDDAPRHAATTPLRGCLRGATTESLARILDVLHSCSVRATGERAKDTIDESVDGTLEELAEKYGLIVE